MRVGIDARELCGHPTGVGRYLSGLLAAWAIDPVAKRHEFILYAHEPLGLHLDARHVFTRTVRGSGGTWWEQVRIPAAIGRDHLDVFFSPAYSTPLLLTIPTVVALHDLSFVAHPEWFSAREGARRRWLARRAAARARAVITISEFSRQEIRNRFQVPDDRIHVIPPGVTTPTRESVRTHDGVRILYVGSIFNRRRVPDLIRAFAPIAAAHSQAALDLVGENRTFPHQDLDRVIAHEGLNGRVHWKPYVSDEELSALYASARVFAFLSEYEGLGLTPLEALAAGVPPVLLDTAVARECCGVAALYVQPDDIRGTTAALTDLLFDTGQRAALLAAAPRRLARYNGPRAATETLNLLERCARP